MQVNRDIPVGFEFPPVMKTMTLERMCVFSDMEDSTCAGHFQFAPRNIHKDVEFAKKQGFPRRVGDGLIQTGWVERAMGDLFGEGYYRGGKLATKYIKPVFEDDKVTIILTLKEKAPEGSQVRFNLDVNVFNEKGELVTVGTASALVK